MLNCLFSKEYHSPRIRKLPYRKCRSVRSGCGTGHNLTLSHTFGNERMHFFVLFPSFCLPIIAKNCFLITGFSGHVIMAGRTAAALFVEKLADRLQDRFFVSRDDMSHRVFGNNPEPKSFCRNAMQFLHGNDRYSGCRFLPNNRAVYRLFPGWSPSGSSSPYVHPSDGNLQLQQVFST